MDPLEVGVALAWLLVEAMEALSDASWSFLVEAVVAFSFPAPTAPLNRLYSPLKPFCMISPAIPLLSVCEEEGGGEANSLNVVRVSVWHASLCILSKAWDNCSLSIGVGPESEANDPRRDRSPRGIRDEGLGEWLEDMVGFAFAFLNLNQCIRSIIELYFGRGLEPSNRVCL